MHRDPALLEECRALQRAVEPFSTLAALRAADAWRDLGPRFARLLARIHRHEPTVRPEPGASTGTRELRAVHWNIEHGNWWEPMVVALASHPELRDADLLLLNEVDLGMARAGNRDVTADLAAALGRFGVWAPMFLETTLGRDDDPRCAAGRANEESLFGLAILSRWPIGEVRIVELPSPEAMQFDLERMVGRHVALVAEILRPHQPFVAATAHLEVHRTREHRAVQMRVLVEALRDEKRPIVLSGDFNAHTFDRGLWHSPLSAGMALMTTPGAALRERLQRPDRGPHVEPLFGVLDAAKFAWEPWVDFEPTLLLRLDRVDEAKSFRLLELVAQPFVTWAGSRAKLRLDWFAGRGWIDAAAAPASRGRTVRGLEGPGKASDHAPIMARFG